MQRRRLVEQGIARLMQALPGTDILGTQETGNVDKAHPKPDSMHREKFVSAPRIEMHKHVS